MLMNKIIFENIYNLIPKWRWCDLKFALKKTIILDRDVISYSSFILSEDVEQFDKVIELSIAADGEVEEILNELIENEEKSETSFIERKWIFAIIYDAYTNFQDNVYSVIDDVYSEFEYPEEISNLITYMPSIDGRPIEEKLSEYIDNEKKVWC